MKAGLRQSMAWLRAASLSGALSGALGGCGLLALRALP